MEDPWLQETIYQLKDSLRGEEILHPRNMGAIAILSLKTQAALSVEMATVWSTRRAIKHILDKNDGEFLIAKTPEIIASHESVYKSKELDKETGRPRILLIKRYPDGKDLFSVIEVKLAGEKNQLVTTARVGKRYLESLERIR
jgi:hypothetical protein